MRPFRWIALGLCVVTAPVAARQTSGDFVGQLEPALVAGRPATSIRLTAATAVQRKAVANRVRPGAELLTGEITWRKQAPVRVYLEKDADGGRAVLADLDANGAIGEAERVVLTPSTARGVALGATLDIAITGASFATYPVAVGVSSTAPAPARQGAAPPPEYLMTSYQVFARGSVDVDGRPVKVQLVVDSTDLGVHPTRSYQYVDCDGDGVFDTDFTSWEMGYAHGTAPVFHVGNRYVSVVAADLRAHRLALADRPAADYRRIELRLGSTLPDFPFVALDGSSHHLSDYRGQYLLIDFWGTWCGPCVGEIPYLEKAYETYRDRGFEILGMDNELPSDTPADLAKGLDTIRKFVADRGVAWTQARTASIKALFEDRFQVVAWPTIVLLDRDGHILSVDRTSRGEPGLRGERLDGTLGALFAGSDAAAGSRGPTAPQQPTATEVYLANLGRDTSPSVNGGVNISRSPGYDNQPSFTPDGKAVLFTSNRDGKQSDIYRYDLATKTLTQLTHTTESEYSPIVTPDGRTFSVIRVEADQTQRLWRFDLDGSNPRLVLENVKPVGYHAWIDARHVALFILGAGREPATLQIADTTTGTAEVVATGIGRSMSMRPGRGTLTFVSKPANGRATIQELDPKTRAITTICETVEGSEDFVWDPAYRQGDGRLLMASGSTIYRWAGADGWKPAGDLAGAGIAGITRLAISPDARAASENRIAIVGQPR